MRSATLAPYLTRRPRLRPPWALIGALFAVAPAALAAPAAASLGGGTGLAGTPSRSAGAGAPPRPVAHRHGYHVRRVPHPRDLAATLTITGGGDGHGIGMSQYGAEGYALHGASARAILAHYYQGTALERVPRARTVRVLIADGAASFSGATAAGATRLSPSTTYTVIASGVGGGVRIVTPTGRTVATAPAAITVTGPGPLAAAGRRYRGALCFSAAAAGTGVRVQTVDIVGLDDYVRGVVAAEMPASWAPAALQAQAIAARTYAITTTVDGDGYDLYDDTRSQMYGGVASETPATDAAVATTAGQVVTYAGAPVVTYFFSSSGGSTESIQNVWPGAAPEPWLRGVADPYDGAAGDPFHAWTVSLGLGRASAELGSLVRGRLERILVTRRGVSPRVMSAEVVGTGGSTMVTGAQLQAAFGLDSSDMSFATS